MNKNVSGMLVGWEKLFKFALRIVNNQNEKLRYGNEKNISTF